MRMIRRRRSLVLNSHFITFEKCRHILNRSIRWVRIYISCRVKTLYDGQDVHPQFEYISYDWPLSWRGISSLAAGLRLHGARPKAKELRSWRHARGRTSLTRLFPHQASGTETRQRSIDHRQSHMQRKDTTYGTGDRFHLDKFSLATMYFPSPSNGEFMLWFELLGR
jgi:hypothetical protein